jgi:hypothetical protein
MCLQANWVRDIIAGSSASPGQCVDNFYERVGDDVGRVERPQMIEGKLSKFPSWIRRDLFQLIEPVPGKRLAEGLGAR